MAQVKITYNELMNKGAKATAPAKVVIVKNILTNLRTYIINSLNS
jgi:hypothetical protein